MKNVVPINALLVGLLGLVMGVAILVWVRPLFSARMYDERLKQAGTKSELVFMWFRLIAIAQRLAFVSIGVVIVGVGVFGIGLYLLGFFGVNPLRLAP